MQQDMTESEEQDVESSDNEADLTPDNNGSVEEISVDTILSRQTSVNLVPFIGQRFVSQDAAYEFYCSFAKQWGFSIRRHRTRGKDGVGKGVTRRDFTCHRGGHPQAKTSDEGKLQRNRKSSRCGCQAFMRIVKRADFDVPEWRVTGFNNNHNHELLKSADMQVFPSHCTISVDDKSRICMFAKAGMSIRQMLRLLELEKGVKLGCLPFTELDIRNLLQSFGHIDKDTDSIDLISMCKRMKDENAEFKYDFKFNGLNRLEHIAWAYPSSMLQYEAFGDAIILDTSHHLDAYDMLLGLWIGIDNNGMACLFGCVLLRDENLLSFAWALKTFLSFMRGKAPKTILTDQNMWLKEVIASEMPGTKHAFCVQHIMANFSVWFSVLLGAHYEDWKTEFYRLYSMETVEEFESGWKEMVVRYGLQSNKHINSLYALREFWALSFLRRFFFAGLMSKSVMETINTFSQRIISAQAELEHFIDKVASIAEYSDQAGMKLKTQQKLQKITLKTGAPMESHAANLLTPYAFSMLQEELLLAPQFASILVDEGCFHIRHHAEMDGGCKVMWDPHQDLVHCSCHQFEFLGILCRHILRVLSINNCFHIPNQYLPNRWRVIDASSSTKHYKHTVPSKDHIEKVQVLESLVSSIVSESAQNEERLDLACEQMSMVLSHIKQIPRTVAHVNEMGFSTPTGSLILPEIRDADGLVQSFTLGNVPESFTEKLEERKSTSGLDLSRKRRRFSIPCCAQFEQDACDCPVTGSGSLHADGDALGFL